MKVTVFRTGGSSVTLEVDADEASVKGIFNIPGSGAVIGRPNLSLVEAAVEEYGNVAAMGMIRVNSSDATLGTTVRDGFSIMIIPKVVGG
jgi:hypothetical protein